MKIWHSLNLRSHAIDSSFFKVFVAFEFLCATFTPFPAKKLAAFKMLGEFDTFIGSKKKQVIAIAEVLTVTKVRSSARINCVHYNSKGKLTTTTIFEEKTLNINIKFV